MIVTGDSVVMNTDWYTFLLLFLVLFFGWTSLLGLTIAFGIDIPGRVAPFNYLQVVMALFFDVLFFDATFRWTDIVGTIFIIGFTFSSSIYTAVKIY
jgi:drug/metabolite transporter (DMT)-like permease